MNARLTAVIALLVGLVAVVVLDVRDRSALAAAMAERHDVVRRLDALAREERSRAEQIEAARARRASLQKSTEAHAASPADRSKTVNRSNSGEQPPMVDESDELRKLRIRAFVGEQRLKFAATLGQLRLTLAQLTMFDEIEAEYQAATLDVAGTAKGRDPGDTKDVGALRREIAAAHDARLRELFGENYDAWQEARRMQGARTTAEELLVQALPGSATVEATQVQALVGLLQRHARPNPAGGYDWEGIATESADVFTGAPLDALRTVLRLRALAEKMNALSGGRR